MRLHFSLFMIGAATVHVSTSLPGLAGDPSDLLLFEDTALSPDQALLPLEPAFLDSTDLAPDAAPDASISPQTEDVAFSLNDLFTAADPLALADCSTSDALFSTVGKSRLKRGAQCANTDELASPPMLSIPTVSDMDEDLRGTIMRDYPGLYDSLWSSQFNDEDNSACIILTTGILPVGACALDTTAALNYKSSRTFPWSGFEMVTLWDVSHVTLGMVELDRIGLNLYGD